MNITMTNIARKHVNQATLTPSKELVRAFIRQSILFYNLSIAPYMSDLVTCLYFVGILCKYLDK